MDDTSESIGTPGSSSPGGDGREAPLEDRQDAVVGGMYATAKKVAEQEITPHVSALGYGDRPQTLIEALAHASTRLAVREVGHDVPIPKLEVELRRSVQGLVQKLLDVRRVVWSSLVTMSGNGGMADLLCDPQGRILSMNGVSDGQVTEVMQLLRDRLCELPLKSADPSLPSEGKVRRLVREAVATARQPKNGS